MWERIVAAIGTVLLIILLYTLFENMPLTAQLGQEFGSNVSSAFTWVGSVFE